MPILTQGSTLQIIFDIITWTAVPAVLTTVLLVTHSFTKKVENQKYRASARSGFLAGFFLFLIILIYQVGFFLKAGFPNLPIYQGFNLFLTLAASFIVFILFGGKHLFPARFSGWVVLLISFASFWAVFQLSCVFGIVAILARWVNWFRSF